MRPFSSCSSPRMLVSALIGFSARPAIQAGMQVAVRRLQRNLGVGHAAQPGGDRRGLDVPHPGVADQRDVRGQFGLVRPQERIEAHRPISSSPSISTVMRAGMPPPAVRQARRASQKHHRLALVVDRTAGRRSACRAGHRRIADRTDRCATATADRPAARRSGHRTGHAAPHSPPARQVTDDHGMAGGRPDRGVESQAGQLVAPPLGRLDAVRGMRRLGADGLDAQQVEQVGARRCQIGIDVIQDRQRGSIGLGQACEFSRVDTASVTDRPPDVIRTDDGATESANTAAHGYLPDRSRPPGDRHRGPHLRSPHGRWPARPGTRRAGGGTCRTPARPRSGLRSTPRGRRGRACPPTASN